MAPLYEPAARPAGLAVTVKLALPVPEVGVTDSHVPPVLVVAAAVKLCDPLTCTIWLGGAAAPSVYANPSNPGLSVNPLLAATLKTIGTWVTIPPPLVSRTEP